MGFDEEAAIGNTRPDHLYKSDWQQDRGSFFTLVIEESGEKSIEYSPPHPSRNRIKIKISFRKDSDRENDQITKVEFLLFKQYTKNGVSRWQNISFSDENPIAFTHFSFEKICQFLEFLTQHDLRSISARRLQLSETSDGPLDAATTETVSKLLTRAGGSELVRDILENGLITSTDIVNIGYRKAQLEVFERLLKSETAVANYCEENGFNQSQIERMWQHFFEKNQWIFGFGLDYRFLGILQKEANLGVSDVSGGGSPIADFLLGAQNFTVIVELKKHNTPLFKNRQNRSGSWCLSNDLFESYAQILEQKASWQIKSETNARRNYDSNGAVISQQNKGSKGNTSYWLIRKIGGSNYEQLNKLQTFELFRRDSRNIEIITFDELFERAKFIVAPNAAKEVPGLGPE